MWVLNIQRARTLFTEPSPPPNNLVFESGFLSGLELTEWTGLPAIHRNLHSNIPRFCIWILETALVSSTDLLVEGHSDFLVYTSPIWWVYHTELMMYDFQRSCQGFLPGPHTDKSFYLNHRITKFVSMKQVQTASWYGCVKVYLQQGKDPPCLRNFSVYIISARSMGIPPCVCME